MTKTTSIEEEKVWSVKLIQHIKEETFKITWGGGSTTLEPLNNLIGINKMFIERARKYTPYPVVATFSHIKRTKEDEFTVWIGPRLVINGLRKSQIPSCEIEISELPFFRKTTLIGNSLAEKPDKELTSAASDGRVSGGCFQTSLSAFLEEFGISLQETQILDIYGRNGYVNLEEVHSLAEQRNWPFRLYRIRGAIRKPDNLLQVMDDHCKYMKEIDRNCQGAEYWRFEAVKLRRKRKYPGKQ
jgi:hypothetical protein